MKRIYKVFLATFLITFAVFVSVPRFGSEVKALSFNFNIPTIPSAPRPPNPPGAPEQPNLPPLPTTPPVQPSGAPMPTPTTQVSTTSTSGGGGDQGGGGGQGGASAPYCGAQTPAAPYLRSVRAVGTGEVELVWDPVSPVTHYSVSYGPSSGNYLYGVADVGNVTSFEVGSLGGTNYCFAVRAVNGCAPSGFSNELCTKAIGGKILGISTLGATGDFLETLVQILFIIGSVCTVVGLKLLLPSKKLV